MTMSLPLDFVLVGPQKCATTWIYECLREHPDVLVPRTDSVHYFDMNYEKGDDWYYEHFDHHDTESVIGETTPSYIRSPQCPARMQETLSEVKILFSVRNPVDRAFSHYWHEKEKGTIKFGFEEVFRNYDLYQNWVEPGLYHYHIQRFRRHFEDENIGVFFFDDLRTSESAFISDIYEFIGADPSFQPSVVGETVNRAWNRFDSDLMNSLYRRGFDLTLKYGPAPVRTMLRPIHEAFQAGQMPLIGGQSEYERGMDSETRKRLETFVLEDVRQLAGAQSRDLSHWFEYHDVDR